MTNAEINDVVLSAMQDIPDKDLIRRKKQTYFEADAEGKAAIRKADPDWLFVYNACDEYLAAGLKPNITADGLTVHIFLIGESSVANRRYGDEAALQFFEFVGNMFVVFPEPCIVGCVNVSDQTWTRTFVNVFTPNCVGKRPRQLQAA